MAIEGASRRYSLAASSRRTAGSTLRLRSRTLGDLRGPSGGSLQSRSTGAE